MKREDRERFALAMAKLRVTFPVNLTIEEEALRTEVYWQRLENYSIYDVEKAIDQALDDFKFFPKPAEIQALIMDGLHMDWIESRRDSIPELDYRPPMVSQERALEIIQMIQKKLEQDDPAGSPTLKGTEAEEFEKKRRRAQVIAKRFVS